ncbi:MAG: glycosyltransferase [Cyclobacteriaceae bacterium]
MRPKISIITPSFNQGQFIEQTIVSVLSQGYSKLDYVIIDGGSTDNTIDIIKKYEKYISYWVSEPDQGQSHAINKGLKKVTGEVVNWLNSDDYLEPDALKIIGGSFTDPSVKILCGRSRKFDSHQAFVSSGTEVYQGNLSKTIGWARIDQPETWFRRTAFETVGALAQNMHYLMDREWWIRYLLCCGNDDILEIPDVLVNFRLHETSKTVSMEQEFEIDHDTIFHGLAKAYGLDELSMLIEKHLQVRPDYSFPKLSRVHFDQSIFDYYFLRKSDQAYFSGDVKKARAFLQKVDVTVLDQPSQVLFKKLKWRSSNLVYPIISLLKDAR